MEYELKVGPQGHIYIPKKIRRALGDELKLLPNAEAGAIYSKDADLNRVIQSLEVIIADLKLQATRPKRSLQRKPTKDESSSASIPATGFLAG